MTDINGSIIVKDGTFTNKNGNVKVLTGDNSTISIRQWHTYPNILPGELYSGEAVHATDAKFATL